jgi:hypothetical protein
MRSLEKQNLNIIRKVGRKRRDANYVKLFRDVSNKMTGSEWAYQFYKAMNLALKVPEETILRRTVERKRVQFSKFSHTLPTSAYSGENFLQTSFSMFFPEFQRWFV